MSLFDMIKEAEAQGKDFLVDRVEYEDGKVCTHCNGYGSSLQDAAEVEKCSVCGGSGLVGQSLFAKPLVIPTEDPEGLGSL